SLLRNWTVGEIGTIAAAVGIIAHFLASEPQVQQLLRENPDLLWQANDEILRIHGPLVDNRRRTTCPVQLGGREIGADQRISINWIAANRDPAVFPDPDRFSLDRDPALNLLYGAGIHVCPGAPLARMELVIAIKALLQHSEQLRLVEAQPARLASYPSSRDAGLPLGAAGGHGAGSREKGMAAAERAAAAGGGTAGATRKLPGLRLRLPVAAAASTPRRAGTARGRWDIT